MRAVSTVTPAVIYCAFAAAVFVVHGSTPDLSVDHVTYLKQASEIIAANPDGFYARNLTSITSYAVLLAYRSADIREIERVGRKYLATFAVVPWTVPGASYLDHYFSIVRIPAGTSGTI